MRSERPRASDRASTQPGPDDGKPSSISIKAGGDAVGTGGGAASACSRRFKPV